MGKYAVVIGVNYVKNPEAALEGCCNDARIMQNLLRTKGFADDDIKLLVDDDSSFDSPNHVNVKNAINWLCTGRSPGDVIFMHFSGHGTQVPADDDDEEEDNLDEAICLEELFLMADDDLKQFFSSLPEGVRATVVMDCCHSGSMLDGTEVAIEGAKDEASEEQVSESDSLLSLLGGSRDVSVNRSLPISTICNVMSQRLGQPVEPTGAGVNGAMAQVFGGNAGKLMMKFALGQMNKSEGGSSNPLIGMLGGLLKKGGSTSTSSSNPLAAMMGGGDTTKSSNPLSGFLGGGGSESNSNPLSGFLGGGSTETEAPPPESQDPMSMLSGLMSGMGLGGQEDTSSAPAYNPAHQPLSRDVCTLITGCQAHETSADVRPPGGDAFGALTKTLTGVFEANPEASYYDIVRGVRTELSKGGFKQNPCLECSEETASLPFIC